ncbi:hypothetical protein SAMN04488500_10378 [Sporomusa malonica]|uniref:Uncharacterized protein n=1 Tax=Sporomusa malonica TaxID=112901 RepID=A0A1W1Z823_9FIRM|nr:hypothetical protein SAMN04488500_10378 [Sporomusa malonica]
MFLALAVFSFTTGIFSMKAFDDTVGFHKRDLKSGEVDVGNLKWIGHQ